MSAPPPAPARFQLQPVGDNVLLLHWADRLAVTADDVSTLITSKELTAAREPPLMLVELNGMMTISRQAFGLLAGSLNAAAVACVGTCPVEQVLITHFQAVHTPPYPIAYVEDRNQALRWLDEQSADRGRALNQRASGTGRRPSMPPKISTLR